MKKIKLKSATAALQDKKLSEEQMNDLLGGLQCPYCGYDFEPEDMGLSHYECTAFDSEANFVTINLFKMSKAEAIAHLEAANYTDIDCKPGEYYNTAPGF